MLVGPRRASLAPTLTRNPRAPHARILQVATKRVKHAIKSDIPCVDDHISKLVHIGKATVGGAEGGPKGPAGAGCTQ
jgi:hypothetical protein